MGQAVTSRAHDGPQARRATPSLFINNECFLNLSCRSIFAYAYAELSPCYNELRILKLEIKKGVWGYMELKKKEARVRAPAATVIPSTSIHHVGAGTAFYVVCYH